MKKYMITAVMLFAQAQDAACSASLRFVRSFNTNIVKRNDNNLPTLYAGEVKNFRDFQRKFPTTTGVLIALGVGMIASVGASELHDRTLGRERQEEMLQIQKATLAFQQQILANQSEILERQRQQALAMATMNGQITILGQLRCPKQNCPPCTSPGNSH